MAKSDGDLYFELGYYSPCNEELDKKKEMENLNKIIELYIKENKIKIFLFSVYYLKAEYSNEILKSLGKAHYKDTDELYKENKLINYIHLRELSKINSNEESINKFKY